MAMQLSRLGFFFRREQCFPFEKKQQKKQQRVIVKVEKSFTETCRR